MQFKKIKNLFKLIWVLFLFILLSFSLFSTWECSSSGESDLVFACMVIPEQNEVESLIWARSIREYGGNYSSNPIWVFVPNTVETLSTGKREELNELGVQLFPFEIDENILRFPLAGKPFAAAEAERLATGKYKFMAWTDPDNMLLNEPREFILSEGMNLGYRPVHHINVGSIYSQPLDEFWSIIYKDCHVPDERVFPMQPNVEDIDIRPYINAGHLVVNPGRGLFRKWRENFVKLYSQPAYMEIYRKNPRYAVFVHQAILSATVLSEMKNEEICELSVKYNYPLNLYFDIPLEKRIKKLNDLVTARYDLFADYQHWNALIEIEEPLKSWIFEQFRLKGVNILVLLDNKFGANNFLNRDGFEQYGWNVTISGLSDSISGCDFFSEPYQFQPIVPDIKFDQVVNIDYYDALMIMPASSYYQTDPFRELMDNKKAMDIIKEAVQKNVPVSTICSGTRVLAAADVIRSKNVVGQPSFKEEYEKAGAVFLGKDFPPRIEGCIMTGSRDQYYNNHVVMALATMIEERGSRGPHKNKPDEKFIISSPVQFGADDVKWAKRIGGFGADGLRAIIETKDNGFLLTGYTFSHGSGDSDVLVVKTNADGDVNWYKTFGGDGTEYGYGCTELSDGYLITGYTTSSGAGSKDMYVIKIDFNGSELWSRTYGGESWDVGMSSCESDDGYMICGFTHSSGKGEEDIYLVNTDRNGNQLWSKTYGGERFEIGSSTCRLDDGNFIIGGSTGTFGGGNSDMYLVKVDNKGNELWTNSIGGQMNNILPEASPTPTDWCYQLKPVSGQGFILVGYSNSRDILNALVIKTDDDGNFVWGQNLGNSKFYDYGLSVAETANEKFIICGTSKSIKQNNDIFLAEIGKRGNVIWQKTIGTENGSDWGSAVCITKDGRIIVAGQTNSFGPGPCDAFLMELANNKGD